MTFYDESYHALAAVLGGLFVTADEKYLRTVGPDPHLFGLAYSPPPVILLPQLTA